MRNVTGPATGKIFGIGMLFLALSVAGALGYQSDSFVIARILGAERVTEYAVSDEVVLYRTNWFLSSYCRPCGLRTQEAFARG